MNLRSGRLFPVEKWVYRAERYPEWICPRGRAREQVLWGSCEWPALEFQAEGEI
jgi:hypothetical protein